ncbi:DNA binding protein [Bifidobacterium goeldii]|uniref:DNA binding protein n=1 Tax=Bifidobacterium goeldii TaxID=2306975 RepID=A0A430FMV2_9BIFI|nr:septation protein SepH [Bifidobacterium goeldii]RSX54154.1 DNA binding protein [Bifidobacterium goeldii]
MPDKPVTQARFDHVDGAGRLVFAAGDERFAVNVDETLERALLEAKQVRDEQTRSAQPTTTATLPISQIQALIRAGADPARVAERYQLSEALVRRFSAAVEVEKQYAIEQFFTVPAPKETRVRTIAELIERTLATAGIGMESVTWRATRRGLEPWRISALFTSAGRQVKAEWSWNMHDNAVSPLNPTARKLMGAQNSSAPGMEGGDEFSMPVALPGDSVRSARIERAVSAWNTPQPTLPAARPEARMPRTAGDVANGLSNGLASGLANGLTNNANGVAGSANAGHTAPSAAQAHAMPAATDAARSANTVNASPVLTVPSNNETVVTPPAAQADGERITETITVPGATEASHSAQTSSAQASSGTAASGTTDGTSQTNQQTNQQAANAKPAKRRSGRSAVPSWDEILFGE